MSENQIFTEINSKAKNQRIYVGTQFSNNRNGFEGNVGYDICDFLSIDLNNPSSFSKCRLMRLKVVMDNYAITQDLRRELNEEIEIRQNILSRNNNATNQKNLQTYINKNKFNAYEDIIRKIVFYFKTYEGSMNVDSFIVFMQENNICSRITKEKTVIFPEIDDSKQIEEMSDKDNALQHLLYIDAQADILKLSKSEGFKQRRSEFLIKHASSWSYIERYVCSTYESNELLVPTLIEPLCVATIINVLEGGGVFKMCAHCNQWFPIFSRSDEKYCLRVNWKGKTCREAVATKKARQRADEYVSKRTKSIYQMYRNRGDLQGRLEFKHDARNNRKAMTPQDFKDWLANYKLPSKREIRNV